MKQLLFVLFFLISSSIQLKTENPLPGVTHEGGLIQLSPTAEMFYWLFFAKQNADNKPLVILLVGGPGCALPSGIFMQSGPYYVKRNSDNSVYLQENPHTWTNFANVVYLDNPVGVGFSDANQEDYTTNEDQIAANLYKFLIGFLIKYPQFKNRALFIHGESYGGKFAVAFGKYIHQYSNPDIRLEGVSIQNPLIDVERQFPTSSEFLRIHNLATEEVLDEIDAKMVDCVNLIRSGQFNSSTKSVCSGARGLAYGSPPAFNYYSVYTPCLTNSCYDFSAPAQFVDQQNIKEYLGVSHKVAENCDFNVMGSLSADYVSSSIPHVEYLVNNDIRVINIIGKDDYLDNYLGQDAWMNDMNWCGIKQFSNKRYRNYKNKAEYKRHKNLSAIRILDAGHLTSAEKPEVVAEVFEKFIKGHL